MPLYRYKCVVCSRIRKVLTDESPQSMVACNHCHETTKELIMAVRQYSAATTQNVEILDNGLAAKPVERYSDAERLFTERAQKHTLEHQEDGSDTHT